MGLDQFRKEYQKDSLNESTLKKDPWVQFTEWFDEACASDILEPNSMCLSTVNASLKPSSRIVLLKEIKKEGFVFFSNYQSRKAKDLEENPNACLNFLWKELERQVRIEGLVQKISEEESTKYFNSRPRGSMIGSFISPQSQVIPNRELLVKKFQELENSLDAISKPEHWGGYILIPDYFEFWQGRPNRLHDRFRYTKLENVWQPDRLAP
ncbi:MAG: pyridoxamine 5'-phosphate oxidase [Bacteroidota bacterium]|nr:pyridoxamine 5'-phosphate oxidase [Bacteroidota bacterium]